MSRPGKALRDQAKIRALGSTPEAIAERKRYAEIVEKIGIEREAKYPTVDATNLREVLAWQEARISELLKGAK